MSITLSELKENPAKYFELAKQGDIIVTRRGVRLGRIISEEKAERSDKQRAIEALIGSVTFPLEYSDQNYDSDYDILREAIKRDRGLL